MSDETTPAQAPAEMDKEQANKTLDEERKQRADKCGAQIQEALKQHNCTLDVVMMVSTKGNVPQFLVTPQD